MVLALDPSFGGIEALWWDAGEELFEVGLPEDKPRCTEEEAEATYTKAGWTFVRLIPPADAGR
jgi:hypothetical protein